jgi:ubiquinone/menaquinone biosynthesis C-methylase UbiE
MEQKPHTDSVAEWYDLHPISERQILEKLEQDNVDLAGLSEDTLQSYDQDHFGGVGSNDELAQLAGLDEDCHVLDVCSGMGGPARYLAHTYGCRVTGIDLTASRVEGAIRLTEMTDLADRVVFQCADALNNPYPDQTFDVVISQEAFCHIPDKARLIGECTRVLKEGGTIAFTDILAKNHLDASTRERLRAEMMMADLETESGYRQLLEQNGCTVLKVQDLSDYWAEILVARHTMYRSLKDQTVARFGAANFKKWDDAYGHFVGLYKTGELGGGRFFARLE